MAAFASIKMGVILGGIDCTKNIMLVELAFFVLFIFPFYFMVREIFLKMKQIKEDYKYSGNLNRFLVNISRYPSFFAGDLVNGTKKLTSEMSDILSSDRCSVWLYNEDKTSILCEQLYIKSENEWLEELELSINDYPEYFEALIKDPIIVAHDAESHPATSCFTESYLRPLGIKSMLDVPIIYDGDVIGVICVENLAERKWRDDEILFLQNISSIYSFSYSVAVTTSLKKDILELERFVNESVIVSKADVKGKITYVNKKFEDVSGWTLDEVKGEDHRIVNSGEHKGDFWKDMYRKVISEKDVWHALVTNKSKTGEAYYVDTYIKGIFDQETGEFKGFMSIRQDLTDIIKANKEIEKKNTYLEHAAKILRHDMHSGINTYIPRGISSLERRLSDDSIRELKVEAPLKMIKEGLRHTQKVYRGVYEFTNLVKKDSCLNKTECDLKKILDDYLTSTAYKSQVIISDLGTFEVNEALFCTSIDNLIRNGLRYNDSNTKEVQIKRDGEYLLIEDNGRGMNSEDFKKLSQPYVRKEGQAESGTGLGLNICKAILEEHGFSIDSSILPQGGTQIKIKLTR